MRNSRADFFRLLAEALDTASRGLGVEPRSHITQIALRQLEAMQAWTANGRTPTADEQNRIEIGVRAGRELGDSGRPETEEWVEQLTELDNYFQGWPTDAEASSPQASDVAGFLEKIDRRKLFGKGPRAPNTLERE